MDDKKLAAYKKAQKRVRQIKRFYRHLTVYIVVNLLIVYFGFRGIDLLEMNSNDLDPNMTLWLFWNVLSTPILWGIGLLIHGLVVFRPLHGIFKGWEDRQLKKFLEEEYRKEKPL